MFGATAGFFAALVLALSPLFFGFARFATLDPALAFFLTAALAAFYLAAREDSFSQPSARRWMLISAAMLAMGTLAKGPIALLLGGAIALAWLAFERRLREIVQMPLVWCGLIYAAIVLPWFMLMEARNPGFLRFFFIHEHLERYVSSSEHGWGPWFFIPIVIGGTWPWIFFVPLGWSAMRADDTLPNSRAGLIAPLRRELSRHLVRRHLRVLLDSTLEARQLHPARASSAGDRRRIRPRAVARSRRRESPSPFRRSLRLRTWCSQPLSSYFSNSHACRYLQRSGFDALLIAAVLAAGAIAMYALGRTATRVPHAIGALALAMLATVPLSARAARRRVFDFHLSQPCECRSALSRRRLHARLVSPLRPVAAVLYAQSRDPRRVLGRAIRSFSADARQVAVSHRFRSAPAPNLVVGFVHGSDRECSRSEGPRRFAEACASRPRMRGKKVRALQWRPHPAAIRGRLPRCQCKKIAEAESRHLDSGAFDCSFAVERLIAGG